ncbi:MAG: hypothetical protein LUQ50_08955 [Methanospirillum sp.]|uniref:hypothetical protein n=1 Tax=Methanospirillum sp. TaxID=45200 RepID=UPI00237411E3|nr:hypothetical protein [Methanospirillum sp.]MDD1729186.1 hypothetical protein [Methanospirillum sp.]
MTEFRIRLRFRESKRTFLTMNTNTHKTQVRIMAFCIALLIGTSTVASAGTTFPEEWYLNLSGDHQTTITQSEYEMDVDIQQPSNHFASVVDQQGQVWDGMPLRYLVHQVEDTSVPDYSVTISSSDGRSITLPGSEIEQNNAFILAHAKNGVPILQTDPSYPLVLAGKDLTEDMMITGVSALTLNLQKN